MRTGQDNSPYRRQNKGAFMAFFYSLTCNSTKLIFIKAGLVSRPTYMSVENVNLFVIAFNYEKDCSERLFINNNSF